MLKYFKTVIVFRKIMSKFKFRTFIKNKNVDFRYILQQIKKENLAIDIVERYL